jgi:hypothetical protein
MLGFQCDMCKTFHPSNEMCKVLVSVPTGKSTGNVNEDKDTDIYECDLVCATRVNNFIKSIQKEPKVYEH